MKDERLIAQRIVEGCEFDWNKVLRFCNKYSRYENQDYDNEISVFEFEDESKIIMDGVARKVTRQ